MEWIYEELPNIKSAGTEVTANLYPPATSIACDSVKR